MTKELEEKVCRFFFEKKNPSTNFEKLVVNKYIDLRQDIRELNDKTIQKFIHSLQYFTLIISELPENKEYYILEKQIYYSLINLEELVDYKINILTNKLKIIDNLTSSERKRKKNA